jgi:hypothetical protein
VDLKVAGTKRKIQIVKLEEWREKAYHSAKLYKERTKRWHDKGIKIEQFKPGDKGKKQSHAETRGKISEISGRPAKLLGCPAK